MRCIYIMIRFCRASNYQSGSSQNYWLNLPMTILIYVACARWVGNVILLMSKVENIVQYYFTMRSSLRGR